MTKTTKAAGLAAVERKTIDRHGYPLQCVSIDIMKAWAELAPHIAGTWTVEPKFRIDSDRVGWIVAVRDDGLRISIMPVARGSMNAVAHLSVQSGDYLLPDGKNADVARLLGLPYGDKLASATIDATKRGPAAIAADIQRRVISKLQPLLPKLAEEIAKCITAPDARALLTNLVAQWHHVDGTSASDLLDEIANEALRLKLVNNDEAERLAADEYGDD